MSKNMKRILLTVVSALLLMAVTVVGTLAYLQSETGPVTNTFVVGNVTITLDEGPVYELADQQAEGSTVTDEQLGTHEPDHTAAENRVDGNSYKLVPGKDYDKDPIVHVADNSEDCYVFVQVINTLTAIEVQGDDDKPTIAEQMTDNGWVQLKDANGNDVANVFYYKGDLAKDGESRVAAGTDLPVFTNFYIADDANVGTVPADVTIRAYAVQAENLDSPEAAWAAAPCTWTATN